jgi:RNA polymerase sigma-70 factor (ECF subfamily)
MLGQVQESEDLVQETYLRWHQADTTTIETPIAWLATVVTRLAIDRLRLASERTRYVGPWLPEPLARGSDHADYPLHHQDALSMAFLVTLERLAPEERAAFLLRDVFDEDYAAIGAILDKREPAVRQIVHRARRRVRDDRPFSCRWRGGPASHRPIPRRRGAAGQGRIAGRPRRAGHLHG